MNLIQLVESRNFWMYLAVGQSLLGTVVVKAQERQNQRLFSIAGRLAKIVEENDIVLTDEDAKALHKLGLLKLVK